MPSSPSSHVSGLRRQEMVGYMNNGTLFRLPDYVKAPPPPFSLLCAGRQAAAAARG